VQRAAERPVLAVLGLEARPDDAVPRALAARLTDELRTVVARSRFELSPRHAQLVELQQLASCPDRDAPACLADIGSFLDVDYLLYGRLERRGEAFSVRLGLLDVARRVTRRVYARDRVTDARRTAEDGFANLAEAW
jgi:hypothetical protein